MKRNHESGEREEEDMGGADRTSGPVRERRGSASRPARGGSVGSDLPDAEAAGDVAGQPMGPESGDLRFEDALDRLEALVEEMESGDLALEETIARFEEGQRLLRTCGQLLDRAEQRVRVILRRADGTLGSEPWEGEEAVGDDGV